MKVAFLTAGGIAPCLSASIVSLIKFYNNSDVSVEFIGYLHGYKGLLKGKSIKIPKDLGEFWEEETGLPIPLGGIVIKRSLPFKLQEKMERVLRKSVEHAFVNPNSSDNYVKCHAQEMKKVVIDAHINLYVNDFSISLGLEGRKAVQLLFKKSGKN